MHDNEHHGGTSPHATRPRARVVVALTATAAVLIGGATTAFAASNAQADSNRPPVNLVLLNPTAGDVAGSGGDFTTLVMATARNADGNRALSAANGYKPGINLPPAPTFGPGKPDPFAPGLVLTLSTTPAAAGGPQANLAGVFQLNTVTRHNGLKRVINDWEVGSPGFFGTQGRVVLTAYYVKGTAPGVVTGHEEKISNVVRETFTLGR